MAISVYWKMKSLLFQRGENDIPNNIMFTIWNKIGNPIEENYENSIYEWRQLVNQEFPNKKK